MTTFRHWLSQQTHRDDPIGTLAIDLARDECARYLRKPEAILAHIEDFHDPDSLALLAFQRAVDEWSRAGRAPLGHSYTRGVHTKDSPNPALPALMERDQ